MPQFPKRESDVVVLAHKMIAGYTAYPANFPHANVADLTAVTDAYSAAKDDQTAKVAVAAIATEFKDNKLAELEAIMAAQLRQSELDTVDDPEKLKMIGWAPRSAPQPTPPPGQPRNLDPIVQGPGTLHLDWKIPGRGSGGPVRAYIIRRRDQPIGSGSFGEWKQVGTSFDPEITLTEQPRGQQLEYVVVAVNGSGESAPSNTAPVVL